MLNCTLLDNNLMAQQHIGMESSKIKKAMKAD